MGANLISAAIRGHALTYKEWCLGVLGVMIVLSILVYGFGL